MSFEVTGRVWRESRAGGSGRLVLLALAELADADGVCWPSMEVLCRRVGLSARQVGRLVAGLVGDGELEMQKGGGMGRFNLYWVRCGLAADAEAPWERGARVPEFARRKGAARDVEPHRYPVARDAGTRGRGAGRTRSRGDTESGRGADGVMGRGGNL